MTEGPATSSTRLRLRARLGDPGPLGWFPLAVLIGLAGVQSFDANAFGILAPEIQKTFSLSSGAIDSIATLTSAIPIIFSVQMGFYGDRHNRLAISAVCGVIWGLTAILTGLAPVVWVLIAARILGGVGQLTTETVYPSLLADFYPAGILGLIFTRYRWISQAVGILGAPLAGVLAVATGWRTTFVILALPTFVFVLALRRLHEPPRGESLGYSLGEEEIHSVRQGFRGVSKIRTLRRTWLAAFLFGAGTIPLQTVLNTFFNDVYHVGSAGRGWISFLFGAGGVAGMVLGGRFTHRAVLAGSTAALATISALMIVECGIGIAVMVAVPSLAGSIVASVLLALGAFGFLPSYTALVAFVAPPRLRAQAYGWSLLCYALGAIIITTGVVGPILNAYGQRTGLAVLAALTTLGGLIGLTTARFVETDVANAAAGG